MKKEIEVEVKKDNLSLDKFYPKKQELISKVEESKSIVVIKTKDDYALVESKRKDFKKIASGFKTTGLELRAEATAFNRKVLEVEHELIDLVKPEEKRLEELSAIWEKEQEKEKRKKSLPQRKNDLRFIYEAYNVDYVEVEDDYLLSLNDFEFDQFKNDRKLIILNEKEKAQEEIRLKTERELNERIQKRKDLLREVGITEFLESNLLLDEANFFVLVQNEKDRLEAIKKAKEKIDEIIKQKTELRISRIKLFIPYGIYFSSNDRIEELSEEEFNIKLNLVKESFDKEQKDREEKIKQDAIAEEKRRVEKEDQQKKDKELIEKQKQIHEQMQLEKKRKYNKFLQENGYTEETKHLFNVDNTGSKVILWEKKAEFII